MTHPFIIEHRNRRATITGSEVKLEKVRERPKSKPVAEQVWPVITKADAIAAWNAALLWAKYGTIDIEEQPTRKDFA